MASPFPEGSFGGLISYHQVGMIAVVLLMLVLLFLFFRFTSVGLAVRAAAQDPESARLCGISVGWMVALGRSEEHTSELQPLMRTSYAVFCLKKKKRKYK